MAMPQNRTLQQFKLSRTNKALGVINVGIAAKDAEAIEEILDRNVPRTNVRRVRVRAADRLHTRGCACCHHQRIESVQSNRGNSDKRRTFGNFQKDYSEYLVQLMQMLCVPHTLPDIVRHT
jgi:hypothetical protein